MSRRARASSALALALAAPLADACPCGVDAGPTAPITTAVERWGLSAGLSWAREVGTWDARGRARPEPAGVRVDLASVDLAAALRLAGAWELSARAAVVLRDVAQPGLDDRHVGPGDTTLRARWEPVRGDAPSARPDVALWSAVRIPTATSGDRGDAWALPASGLGAWELGLGAQAQWRLTRAWLAGVVLEGAARTHGLGPRASATASVVARPSDRWALSLAVGAQWELSPDGAPRPTVFRRTTVGLAAQWQATDLVRPALSLACDALVDQLGADASAQCRVGLGVTVAR